MKFSQDDFIHKGKNLLFSLLKMVKYECFVILGCHFNYLAAIKIQE